jgi:hypothetical protein
MQVTVEGKFSTEIEDDTVKRVLSMFPEEELHERPVFKDAFERGSINFRDLKSECGKLLIPWQMLFLERAVLQSQLSHIESQRRGKVSEKLFAKRRGEGDTISKRILDRLIRQQDYLVSTSNFVKNRLNGSLIGLSIRDASVRYLEILQIDRGKLWKLASKESALNYLTLKAGACNINVSMGVLSNRLLPSNKVVPASVYRDTSGFVIKDEKVPFVFLPSEINPSEVASRQIYTLTFLLVCIGLERFDHVLDRRIGPRMLGSKGAEKEIHSIVAEVLMPEKEMVELCREELEAEDRDRAAERYKVSPTALVTSLRVRGFISKEAYDALKPEPFEPPKSKTPQKQPRVSTSVGKFCGRHSMDAINQGLQTGALTGVQAQHLIWGAVNKSGFRKYRKELAL